MGKQLEIVVAPGHRYNELSIRLQDGEKLWVNKWSVTTVDTDQMADGEEFMLERYLQEGRITVVEVAEAPPRRKSGRKVERDDDDLEE